MIKVLIVEDSRVVSEYLEYVISQDPKIEVIGNVSNGKEAIEFIKKTKPDVITMDIDMPIMGGLEATRIIMSTTPIPIIIVTASRNASEVEISMEALASGALSVIEKPAGFGHKNEKLSKEKLLTMIKVFSEVKVITRKPIKKIKPKSKKVSKIGSPLLSKFYNKKIMAIGISSGGPTVLLKIFSKIAENFPYPILVVQHITVGFLEGLVNWLRNNLSIPLHIATDRETIQPGHIYFAPELHHMEISNFKIKLVKCKSKTISLCPSISQLFSSLVKNYGKDTIAFLLTGMGADGAKELKMLRDAGAITIVQDKESSLVHGMPGVAIKMDAAEYIQNPDEIENLLFELEKHSLNMKILNFETYDKNTEN